MIKNRVRSVMIPLAFTSLMFVNGCKEKVVPPTPKFDTNLLLGDWLLTELDGEDYTSNYSSIHLKFEESGDVQTCYEYVTDPTNNSCTTEKWRWEDSNQAAIIITDTSNSEENKLDIVILDETRFEGNVIYDTWTSSFKFIKVQ